MRIWNSSQKQRSRLKIYNERINDEQIEIGIQSVRDVVQWLSTIGY